MSYYKPKFVEKGTKQNNYVEKGTEKGTGKPKTNQWVQKKGNTGKYKEINTGGYDYDSSKITEETVVPKLPNQVLAVPDREDYKKRQQVCLDEIKDLKEKKRNVHKSKFLKEKVVGNGEKGISARSQFEIETQEINKMRQKKNALLNEIRPRKDEIQKLNEEFQRIRQQLRDLEDSKRDSKQELEYRLQELKNKLLGGALSPKDQKTLNHQIQVLKKQLGSAKPFQQSQVRIRMLQQTKKQLHTRIDKLHKQKKPLTDQFQQINESYNKQFNKIKSLKQKINQEYKNRENEKQKYDKQREDFEQSKFDEKNKIDDDIDNIYDRIDIIWDEYDNKVEQQKKQQYLIDHINWMNRQKQYLKEQRLRQLKKKQQEEKRKQWQQRQKQREKQREERQKNRPRKYTPQVNHCQFLLSYCQKLIPKHVTQSKPTQEVQKPSTQQIQKKLTNDQQWKKQKGVQLIQSKKSRQQDVQIKPKKVKKQQIQSQKPKQVLTYTHDFSILSLFQQVKTLPPKVQQDIQKTMKQLQERKQYFQKMNQDQSSIIPLSKPQYKTKDQQQQNDERPRHRNNNKKQEFKPKVEDFPAL